MYIVPVCGEEYVINITNKSALDTSTLFLRQRNHFLAELTRLLDEPVEIRKAFIFNECLLSPIRTCQRATPDETARRRRDRRDNEGGKGRQRGQGGGLHENRGLLEAAILYLVLY